MIPNFTQEPQLITVLVQGEEAVNRYPVGIGNTVLLMDFNANRFWIKTNPNGIPQPARSFEFKETTPAQNQNGGDAVSREEFNKLSEQINKLIEELGGNK